MLIQGPYLESQHSTRVHAVIAVLTHNIQQVCIAGTVCLCVATYAPHAAGSRHYMWRPSLPFIVMAALAASSWW